MGVSKVNYGSNVLIDLTQDTVTADKLLSGITAHGADGEIVTGSCTFDSDTKNATAKANEILATKTAYVNGIKVEGTMPNCGGVTGTISTKDGKFSIPVGYHDGSGKVSIDDTEKAKIKAENIRDGVTILGVVGEMSITEGEHPEDSKEVTPTQTQQTILPSEGYTCMREVIVKPIPYTETDNAAGGKTVTIG